ncbi:nitrite reductase small subunit NirD [Marinobacter salicampi]|uniref:nitrite reductase small subunit NirD n=1 Tax=Marinobacter salicampi TaxID=435907 RepID=UPI001407B1C2|nr:nitrite reductase small subunit NirD [Marinobacter salicampi]
MKVTTQWDVVCKVADLVPDSGVAVWTSSGPVAVFYLPERLPALFAIGHQDPFSGANVLARGITGDIKGEPVVASPLYKQHFSLLSGQCLEDESVRVPVYRVLVDGDQIRVEQRLGSRDELAA